MKKITKTIAQIIIAILILGLGVKLLYNFLLNTEDKEITHREPYQPEE